MKRGGRITVGVILLIALGGAAWGYFTWGRASKGPELKFETTRVERGRIVARVTATGTLSALVTVQVGSQVSGRIQSLAADFNTRVKKGQVIARIDPQMFQAAVEQSRANHLAAQSNLARSKAQAADAERQAARARTLNEQKLIAQAELDTAQANADAARAQVLAGEAAVAQARASLHQAQINLDYTTIVSPIDGVVISRTVDVGQTVAASLQAPTLFTIAEDLRKMQVDTSVAEADVGKLQPGMTTMFTVDAYPTERFRGKVRQIRNAPQTVQNVVTYDAVIDVDNPDLKLKPGMTANVTFVWAEKDDVLKVPNAALRFRPPAELLGDAAAGTRRRGQGGASAGQGSASTGQGSASTVQGTASAVQGTASTGQGTASTVQGTASAVQGTASAVQGTASTGQGTASAVQGPASAVQGTASAGQGSGSGGGRRGNRGDGGPPAPDRRTLWVLKAGKPESTPVRIGVSDGTMTEIVEGVAEGDEVITDTTGGTPRPAGGAGGGSGGGGRGFGRVL